MPPLTQGTFAALPHVRVQGTRDIAIGDFLLWPNSAAEWKRRTGVDNTAFLDIYRDERAQPVGARGSILSTPDLSDAPPEAFRDAVYSLSTAAWLSGRTASDPWVFERWSVPLPTAVGEWFRRRGRFSVNLTSAEVDRVYPTPYTYRIDVDSSWTPILSWLTSEMRRPRGESVLTALSHFHLARFNTPYFTSPGDAIEALWSGLESILSIDDFSPPKHLWDRAVDYIPLAMLRRLARALMPRRDVIRKSDRLVLALREEFRERPLRAEFWEGVEFWAGRFYDHRNHHTHGMRTEMESTLVETYEVTSYEIGLRIAEMLLFLRAFGDNIFFVAERADLLGDLFVEAPAVRRLVKALRDNDRKVWFPGTTPIAKVLLDTVAQDIQAIVELRRVGGRFQGDGTLDDARHKMGLALSDWVKALNARPPSDVDLSPISNVPSRYTAILAQKPTPSKADVHDQVAEELEAAGATSPDAYGVSPSAVPAAVMIRGRIPVWQWVAGYVRLSELHQGHGFG